MTVLIVPLQQWEGTRAIQPVYDLFSRAINIINLKILNFSRLARWEKSSLARGNRGGVKNALVAPLATTCHKEVFFLLWKNRSI